MELEEEVIHTNSYDHFKIRAAMYTPVGTVRESGLNFNPDVGFGNEHMAWDSATLHFAKEVLANAIDAVMRSPIRKPIEMQSQEFNISGAKSTSFEVMNYGNPIPRKMMSECLTRPRTGTNFKVVRGIGRNGYGTKIVLALSCRFDAVCMYADGTFDHLVAQNDGTSTTVTGLSEMPEILGRNLTLLEPGTYIRYEIPHGTYNDVDSIAKIRSTIVEFSVALNMPFVFNEEAIMHSWKDIPGTQIHLSGSLCLNCSKESCACAGNERFNFHIMEPMVGNLCPVTGFVNGLRTDEGAHVAPLKKAVRAVVRAFFDEKGIKGDIPDFRLFVNLFCEDPQQEGQSKGRLMTMKPIEFPSFRSILKWPCIEQIVLQNRKKVLSTAKKLKPIENTAYIPAKIPGGILLLGEGLSVLGYLNRVRSSLPNICGIYTLKGKCLNCVNATADSIAKSAVISGLSSALDLDVSSTDIHKCKYSKIVIAADADDDGLHIATLIVGIFVTLWPDIIARGMLYYLASPIIKVFNSQNQILERFYAAPKIPISASLGVKYYKGLGSSNDADIDDDFATAPVYRIANHGEEDLENFKAAMCSTTIRKNIISGPDTPDRVLTHTTLNNMGFIPPETLSLADVVHQMYRRYMLRSMLRALPGSQDGLKDCVRKILYTVLSSAKKSYKVEALANQTSSGTAYHHGPASLANAIVLIGRKFDNNLPLLAGDGQFGTVKGGDDANPRYLKVDVPKYLRNLFPLHDIYPNQISEGQKIEPKILQPILPLVLLNSGSGIASGWSYKCLGTSPQILIDCIRRYITGGSYIYQVSVGEGQEIVRESADSWILKGTLLRGSVAGCYVLDTPAPGKTFQNAIELVQKYVKDAHAHAASAKIKAKNPDEAPKPLAPFENSINSTAEYHNGRLELTSISEAIATQIEGYRFKFNLNFMHSSGHLMEWTSPEPYLNYYIGEVLETYKIRRENLIRANRRALDLCIMKIQYIEMSRVQDLRDISRLETIIQHHKWDRDIVSKITDFDKTDFHLQKLQKTRESLENFSPKTPVELYLDDLNALEIALPRV
jgi:DNA gyrase/topoisomerase IV subunit B